MSANFEIFSADYEESQSESEAVSSRQEQLRHIKSPLMSPQSATSETEEESRDGESFPINFSFLN